MTKILSQQFNNKFFRNVCLSSDEKITVIPTNVSGNIYELYYRYNFDKLIIHSQSLDNSVLQFAIEYGNKISIYIYVENIDSIPENLYKSYNMLTFIHDKGHSKDGMKTIQTPYLINDKLYKNKPFAKTRYICCFLDNVKSISTKIMKYLYPNNISNEFGIRMFNNPNIQHHQNLGTIDEFDRSNILKEAEYYLDIDGEYQMEAAIVGCKIIDEDGLENLSEKYPETKPTQSYSDFLRTL